MKTTTGIAFALIAIVTTIGGLLLANSHPSMQNALHVPGNAEKTDPSIKSSALSVTLAATSDQAAIGEKLYQMKCGACHSLDKNRIGPRHRNIVGKQAGTVTGFKYSNALKRLKAQWTDENLDAWLENPGKFAPGTSMGFRVKKANERKAIIAYLKSVSK
ncbi:c-type cytochrome [Sphingorhabdus sp. Alg239-R122]|uniref:c-type cytochrome n=1 Tax=Sphingorhabdus sp. Alg239-R122 TaxID=2305989 RepID=UPI0013DCAAE8|nr:c-type cytochrome [Sphingorhabdus sp. Alg239-R122]